MNVQYSMWNWRVVSCSGWSVRLLHNCFLCGRGGRCQGFGWTGGAGGGIAWLTCVVVCWRWRVGWHPPPAGSETGVLPCETQTPDIRLNWTKPLHYCVESGLQWWDRITDTSVVWVRDYLLRPLKERQSPLFIWSCSPSSFSCGPPSSSSSSPSRRSWKFLLVSQQSIPK